MHTLENIHIHTACQADIAELIDIWDEATLSSHNFISETVWLAHKESLLAYYIAEADIFLATKGDEIIGFIALINLEVPALFVSPKYQNLGIGSRLLLYVKFICIHLWLRVYKKNKNAIHFYQNHGFLIIDSCIDPLTGEEQFVMDWKNRPLMN